MILSRNQKKGILSILFSGRILPDRKESKIKFLSFAIRFCSLESMNSFRKQDFLISKNRIKKRILKFLFFFIIIQSFVFCGDSQSQEKKEILIHILAELQNDLQKNLETSIQKKGIVNSFEVCKAISTQREADIQNEFPLLKIRMISEKPRNPNQQLETWETDTFDQWRESEKTGLKPYTMIFTESRQVKMLQPILIQNATCLKCHGEAKDINPQVAKKIKELYPHDQATGYKLGDLRGAFSAVW
ncbi:hypothetical protein DLM77_18815 [Leptospira yasudae]|uniref:Tll0287-like domain-containing protein n=1 Tax=Leptospira yasudae TaxID=2202201 RepID=A0ABX9LYW9_9LEPT|nr:hypothetical protein DLM77_18815 [Leptospira yasudae]